MPLEELEALIMDKAERVRQLLVARGDMSPLEDPFMEPTSAVAPAPADEKDAAPPPGPPSPDAFLDTPEPAKVKAATAAMVAAGLLPQASDTVTPEVMAALQALAEKTSPGLYDLTNPEDLAEFLDAVANGSIPLGGEPVAEPGPGPGVSELLGGGLPPAGPGAGGGVGLPGSAAPAV